MTEFQEKILALVDGTGDLTEGHIPKIHTLRAFRKGRNWKVGDKIHMATGTRSINYNQFNKGYEELSTVKSLQRISMGYEDNELRVVIEGRELKKRDNTILLVNDGFTGNLDDDDFIKWFFPEGNGEWQGVIIGWTEFRY